MKYPTTKNKNASSGRCWNSSQKLKIFGFSSNKKHKLKNRKEIIYGCSAQSSPNGWGLASIKEQLAAANDPNLTVISGPHWWTKE